METLRRRFHVRASDDRAGIADALRQGDRGRLLVLAHGLAGIAGIFGQGDVGNRAAALENAVEQGADEAMVQTLGDALVAALDGVAPAG